MFADLQITSCIIIIIIMMVFATLRIATNTLGTRGESFLLRRSFTDKDLVRIVRYLIEVLQLTLPGPKRQCSGVVLGDNERASVPYQHSLRQK